MVWLRPVLPTARTRVVLAHTLPAGEACRPAAMLAGVKIACIPALWALATAAAVREQRGRNGHADRCQEDKRFADALKIHRVDLLSIA